MWYNLSMKVSDYKYIIVGAGFFGATVAERLASRGEKVLVIDRRKHVAGNAYSYRDEKTGIEIHQYGSHIFHTDNEEVWNYITRFTEFNDYTHTVPTRHNGELYPMPINLDTINKLYDTNMDAEEAEKFVAEEARRDCERLGIVEPKNFEEKGISLVGEKLYSTFIKHYSEKQWSTAAENLSAEILKRIPVRYSHDDRYFMDAKHQGIPVNGYGKIVENMLNSENIEVRLGTAFGEIRDEISDDAKIIYCGQVDELLDYKFGVLPYRSLRFEDEWTEDSQNVIDGVGHAVINEADSDVAYTRAHDYKFYQIHEPEVMNQKMSYVCREYPANFEKGGEAYYPVNNPESAALYEKYVKELHDTYPNVILGGRLGAYQYWDMDKAIANALELASNL